MLQGIRFKLSVVTFMLLALITSISSVVVTNVMDGFILGELIKRGFATGKNTATSAAYSLLSGDRLALDNLMVKLKESQGDVLFAAVVDLKGRIKAHNMLGEAGKPFSQAGGESITTGADGATVRKTGEGGVEYFEFGTPIMFAGKRLGDIFFGIDADTLASARSYARKKIISISLAVLILGAVGTFFLSSFITVPIKRLSDGVSLLSSGKHIREIKIVSRDELGDLTKNFNEMAKTITGQRERLEAYSGEVEDAYISMVKVLAAAIDARDPYTLGHSTRVVQLSLLLGKRLGLSEEELKDIEMACLFHDVGKIRTPDYILQKKAPLNNEENVLMMQHSEDGAEILRLVDSLHKHIPAVLHHHEWYNGNGYPAGLQGDAIPLFAAIIAIADAYDAMTSYRPYKKAKSKEEALRELRHFRGKQFAPHITDLFIEVMERCENNHMQTVLEV